MVLSGAQDDGAAGLRELRLNGGVGIVQSPEDAIYPSMPQSAIARAEPEHVLAMPGIVALLVELTDAFAGSVEVGS